MKPRKIEIMRQMFGSCDDHVCKECSNFVSGRYHTKVLRKCQAYGLTHSEASDWAGRWKACGLFNEDWQGKPIIETVKRTAFREPDLPLEGQMTMEDFS